MKLHWHVIQRPPHVAPSTQRFATETNWHRWLDSDVRVDPYLMWAELTKFAGFGGLDALNAPNLNNGRLPILVELDDSSIQLTLPLSHPAGQSCDANAPGCPIEFSLFEIQPAYLDAHVNAGYARLSQRFVTGRVPLANIDALYEHARHVLRFQLGLPRVPRFGQAQPLEGGVSGARDTRQTVVGIIDDGFAFAHGQMLDHVGRCRVWSLWDQDPRRQPDSIQDHTGKPNSTQPPSWTLPARFGYGAEVGNAALCEAVNHALGDPSPYALLGPYRGLRYVPMTPTPDVYATLPPLGGGVSDLTMLTSAHGAAVADLAAGSVPPLGRYRMEQSLHVPNPMPGRQLSTAASWPLILVQLPTRTIQDTSGGSLGVQVLDGVRYILDTARMIPERSKGKDPYRLTFDTGGGPNPDDGQPLHDVIINISYGAMAGPHDGTSILERALEAVADPAHIVLSAGNAQGSRTHARLRLSRGCPPKDFTWYVGPDNPLESYLEIWLPQLAVAGEHEYPLRADDFVLWVRPPGSTDGHRLSVGQALVLEAEGKDQPAAAAVFSRRVAQGENGTMVLLAVTPTRRALAADATVDGVGERPRAPHGMWSVTVGYGVASTPVATDIAVVHAWVERNDLIYHPARGQQSWVVSDDPVPPPTENAPSVREFCRNANKPFTDAAPAPFEPEFSFGSLSGGLPSLHIPDIANGPRDVIVVGGYRASDGEMASYSAGGPARGSQWDNARLPANLCGNAAESRSPDAGSRTSPDLDAPSDVGVALRGVRTIGTRPGLVARLSGTSAAAPTAARAIAEARAVENANSASSSKLFELDPDPFKPAKDLSGPRGTLNPLKDDRYRRGRLRVGPQVAVIKK